MLKALHLNTLLRGGGTDDQCVQLCAHLRRLGVDVGLIGPGESEFAAIARKLEVPVHPTPPEGPGKLRFILTAARLIRRERPHVVHGHHGRDIWPTILAVRWSGVRLRVVLTRHLAKSPSSVVSRHFLLSQVDALIAVSAFVARVLREGHYEPQSPVEERRARPPLRGDTRKIRVIHGGIDASRFRPRSPDMPEILALRQSWGFPADAYVFGVVGGYDLPRGKGQREFLLAAARVAPRLGHARFAIVGRGNMAAVLTEDIRTLGLERVACLTPYCRDMPAAMNALDCLVHPQIGTEAFPGVVLEALACGRRVIASDLDGIPEAFAACAEGRLVEPERVDALANALLAEATAPRLLMPRREAMHAEVATHFDLPVVAGRVHEFYQQLVGAESNG